MSKLGRTKGLLLALGASLVMALLITPALSATAGASPLTLNSSGTDSQKWAYSGEAWSNGTIVLPNATYEYSAFYGWAVIFTSTNTSANTWALEAQRTMATSLNVVLCVPNCNQPSAKATLSISGEEQDVGFANFTNLATVYENGSATTAIGLNNASAQSQGSLQESLSATMTGPSGQTRTASGTLSVSASDSSRVYFGPNPLGLIPLGVTPGTIWNSTANFTGQGSWSQNYQWSRTTFGGSTTSGSANPSGAVNASGVLEVTGHALGRIPLNEQGVAAGSHSMVPVIVLIIQGPFDEIDGIILVPHDFDLFSGDHHPWDANSYGAASFSAEKLDGFVDAFHHFRLVAASAQFNSQDASPLAIGGTTAQTTSVTNAALPSSTIQAQPTSVSAAQQTAQCLLGNCQASPGKSLLVFTVIALVAAAIVAGIAVVAWRSYSRRPSTRGPIGGIGEITSTVLPPAGATVDPLSAGPIVKAPPSPPEPPRRF